MEIDEEERALVAEAAREGQKPSTAKNDKDEEEEDAPPEVVQAVEDEPFRVVKDYKRLVSKGEEHRRVYSVWGRVVGCTLKVSRKFIG